MSVLVQHVHRRVPEEHVARCDSQPLFDPLAVIFDRLRAEMQLQGESTNVAAEHPEVIARLLPLIERGRRVIGDGDKDGSEQRKPGLVDAPKPLTQRAR